MSCELNTPVALLTGKNPNVYLIVTCVGSRDYRGFYKQQNLSALLEFEPQDRLSRSLVTMQSTLHRLHFIETCPVECAKKYIFMFSLHEKFDCSVGVLC